MERKNKNRGYQQLRVWKEAIEYYKHAIDLDPNYASPSHAPGSTFDTPDALVDRSLAAPVAA